MSEVHMSRKNIITKLERNNLGGVTGVMKENTLAWVGRVYINQLFRWYLFFIIFIS